VRKTKAAGGVVVGSGGRVVIVNQNGRSWSLPKGHVDPGESDLEAAIREIREETGLTQLELIRPLGSYERHRIGYPADEDKSELKTITMFLFRTDQTKLAPEDPDNPEARWVKPAEVIELLTHQKDKDFFKSVIPVLTEMLPE
jgi:8-oxo-dGTP pyrophosphatase MutT (NUDIX family)